MMSGGTKATVTRLPEYHLAELAQLASSPIMIAYFKIMIIDYVPFSRSILLQITTTMRGTKRIGPPECRLAE